MRYNLSPNTVRVYKSRLRRLMRILPQVSDQRDREAFAREIVDLETKLGVKVEDIINDKPGPKSFRGDTSKYFTDITTNPEIDESANALDRIASLAEKEKELTSTNAIHTRRSIIQGYITDMSTASQEQREMLRKKALELNERLPSRFSMEKQINEAAVLGWSKEDLDRRAKENLEKFSKQVDDEMKLPEELKKQLSNELNEEDIKRQKAEEEFHRNEKT